MLSQCSSSRQQQNRRKAEKQKDTLETPVHRAGQHQGANLELLVKGSKDGLPLSNLQLSHLLLNGCHLSSHCIVLLPCVIQAPGLLPQHLHSMHLHSMHLHSTHLHSMHLRWMHLRSMHLHSAHLHSMYLHSTHLHSMHLHLHSMHLHSVHLHSIQDVQAKMISWQRLHAVKSLCSANIHIHCGLKLQETICIGHMPRDASHYITVHNEMLSVSSNEMHYFT